MVSLSLNSLHLIFKEPCKIGFDFGFLCDLTNDLRMYLTKLDLDF